MIRAATVEDAAALAAVNVGAKLAGYAEFVDDLDAMETIPEAVAAWRAWLIGPGAGSTWLRDEDGTTVGLVACSSGRIDELMVLPDRFGQGIGSALLAHGEAMLRERGALSATIWTYARNARARALYERHGWELDGAADPGPFGIQVQYRKGLA